MEKIQNQQNSEKIIIMHLGEKITFVQSTMQFMQRWVEIGKQIVYSKDTMENVCKYEFEFKNYQKI